MSLEEEIFSTILKGVFYSAPDALVILDAEGTIQMTNPQCQNLFGYEESELIGKKVEVLMPSRFRENHIHQRDKYIQKPYTRAMGATLDLYGLHKDGREISVEISLSPLNTTKGKYVIAAIRDISEKKEKAHQLANRTKEIEQFVYIASHDLKAPLSTIRQYLQLLYKEQKTALSPEGINYLTRALRSAEHMTSLIHNLLDYSSLGSCKSPEQVDLSEALEQAKENLNHLIQESGAQITLITPLPTLPCLKTECILLFQNLLNNAIKFCKKGKNPQIEIRCIKRDSDYLFSVKDNGIGIAPEYFDKIFALFSKLHSASQYAGNGIGLGHCKKIVELHQGTIWVESTPDQGSTFYFTLKTP